jgi:hypothetical protein
VRPLAGDREKDPELASLFDDLLGRLQPVIPPRIALPRRLGREDVVRLVDDQVEIALPRRIRPLLVVVELLAQQHRNHLAHGEVHLAERDDQERSLGHWFVRYTDHLLDVRHA